MNPAIRTQGLTKKFGELVAVKDLSLEVTRGEVALYPRMTGAQTLSYFAKLRGGVDEDAVGSMKIMSANSPGEWVRTCPAGAAGVASRNRQKIALIQAVMHRPELLILDEPTTGLDPVVQQEFHHYFNAANPLVNGADGGHLAVLAAAGGLAAAIFQRLPTPQSARLTTNMPHRLCGGLLHA